ncbi:MAG: enoyl-CoA hydratase/isomerase family protein [Candidatus Lokiarchaeota archaeon]|nr:enoyl-CoA hydratase/isomerase family protein [Candidatus Lokiarchaeota archaeon]
MSNQELILYEVDNRIATITINRPDKAHAFNIEMLQMMHSRLLEADEDESVKCILIKSTEERFFSAGYDLKEIQGAPEKMSQIKEWGRKVNETMLLLKKPIITQVKGIAVGFGVLMILASDLRIFAERPKEELYLRLPEIAISAFPQTGATLLPLLGFGLTYAKNMLFTADKAGLEDLKNINFPTRVFPLETIDLETRKFLKILTKHQTEFLFFIKSMLTIMNKAYIKSCFDLEDECGKLAFAKKSMKELDDFIKALHKKFP